MEATPPLSDEVREGIDQTIRQALEAAATPPQQRSEEPLPRWTLKRLVGWVKKTFSISIALSTRFS